MIDKLPMHYSFQNLPTVYDEEALTALELAARTAAKTNEVVVDQNKLRTETENHLEAQDKEISDRLAAQDKRLTNQEENIIPETVASEQQRLISNGTFAQEINEYAGNLEERLNSLTGSLTEGSTTMDAEIIDMRTDVKNITHASAGAAARNHQRHYLDSLDRAMYGEFLVFFNWTQGGIDTSTGAVNTSENRIRTTNSKSVNNFDRLTFSVPTGLDVGIVYYYQDTATYRAEWVTPNVETVIDRTATSYRLIAKKTDESAITPAEANYFYPRTRIEALHDKFIDNLKKVTCTTHYACDDSDIEVSMKAERGCRWFVNGFDNAKGINTVIPAGSFIRRLTMPCVDLNKRSATVEIWYLEGNTLTLRTMKTVNQINGKFTIDLNWYAEKDALVSVKSENWIFMYAGSMTGRSLWASYELEATTLDTTSKTQFQRFNDMTLGATLTYETYKVSNGNPSIITVGPGGDYTEIRDAVESITDTRGVYTIIVHPRETPYKPFSMIRKMSTGEVYPWSGATVRNISIIGLDRVHCVVEADTGDYYNPPCEPLCNGVIKNLTFRHTIANQTDATSQGGYAAHIDCPGLNGTAYNILFENCTFMSECGPGAGIGIHQDGKLTFKNCDFHATGNPSYKPYDGYTNIVNYGAIFAHSSTKANVTGQHFTLDNCRIIADNATKALWISSAGEYNPDNCEFIVTAYNNICYAGGGTVKVAMDDDLTLDPSSWGNNDSALNGG